MCLAEYDHYSLKWSAKYNSWNARAVKKKGWVLYVSVDSLWLRKRGGFIGFRRSCCVVIGRALVLCSDFHNWLLGLVFPAAHREKYLVKWQQSLSYNYPICHNEHGEDVLQTQVNSNYVNTDCEWVFFSTESQPNYSSLIQVHVAVLHEAQTNTQHTTQLLTQIDSKLPCCAEESVCSLLLNPSATERDTRVLKRHLIYGPFSLIAVAADTVWTITHCSHKMSILLKRHNVFSLM